jgi:CRISP-associated protein Cas1
VLKGDTKLRDVRVDEIEQLALMGHVSLTSAVIRLLLQRNIDTIFLTLNGRFLGKLSSGLSNHVELRVAQHQFMRDPQQALGFAQRVVRAKIMNQRRLMQRYQKQLNHEEVAKALVKMRYLLEQIQSCTDIDHVRGYEGKAAAEYFGAFGYLLKAPGFLFRKRLRRPPPDPVNVLLSFGYTLLGNQMLSMVEQAGFDPYVGALHAVLRGRASLMLDLIEEFRPLLVDTLVLMVVNRKEITMADFVIPDVQEAELEDEWAREVGEEQGEVAEVPRVIFRKEGVFKWVTAMERRWDEKVFYPPRSESLTYRQIMKEQVYALARHIQGEGEYQGFEGAL